VNKRIPIMACMALLYSAQPVAAQEPKDPPPVFASLSYEDAVARTVGAEKILVDAPFHRWGVECSWPRGLQR
jgi:hypothetical protein